MRNVRELGGRSLQKVLKFRGFPIAPTFLTSPMPVPSDPTAIEAHLTDQLAVGGSADEVRGFEEMEQLTEALSAKFEELSLIHQLSDRLKLGEDCELICRALLDELTPCIDASTLAIDLFQDDDLELAAEIYVSGEPANTDWLRQIANHTREQSSRSVRAAILNSPDDDAVAQVRSVVVSIARDGQCLGQMIAIRELDQDEFGTVEADLMKSTSLMLGVHLINQRQYQEMQAMFEGTIQSLASALDAKDAYTAGHSSRVAELAVELAMRLGYQADDQKRIRMAGILHDIGKIGVEDSVLLKPGRLTAEEFEKIKAHPVLGYEILKGIRQFRDILPAVRHHHESWDGKGYPDGLAGEEIPRDAQVLAVADAFDAMTSDRPYRKGMPLERVIEIFEQGRGSQWAADVVDVLLDCPLLSTTDCVSNDF